MEISGKDPRGSGPARPPAVRDVIAASWRRCREHRVEPSGVVAPYVEPQLDVPLLHAAGPVLERMAEQLCAEPVSTMLTDREGVVLSRTVTHPGLTGRLDRVRLVPGHVFSEKAMGTNGIGTALASGQPVLVEGPEHYVEALQRLRCAAVPILHPTRRTVLGAFNVTTSRPGSSGLLLALAQAVAGQIEGQLAVIGSRRERALFQDYLRACGSVRPGPVLALNRDIVMMNDQFRLTATGPDSEAVLEHARELAADLAFEGTRNIALPSGRVADLRVERSRLGSEDAGAVVRIRLIGRPQPAAVVSSGRDGHRSLGLVGSSRHWLQAVAAGQDGYRAGSSLCLVGEAGVGKTSLVEVLHRAHGGGRRLVVVHPPTSGARQATERWVQELGQHLGDHDGLVLLRETHLLERELQHGVVVAVTERDAATGAQVVMTRQGPLDGPGDRLDAAFDVRVELPPIRYRPDDIEQLVRHFLRRYRPGGELSCSSAALAALQQCPWPGNVRQIDAVVRALARRQSGRVVQKEDLPPECRVSARTVLTQMEALERDAILRALDDGNANVQRTAKSLGISRATMYRKMRRYGISNA